MTKLVPNTSYRQIEDLHDHQTTDRDPSDVCNVDDAGQSQCTHERKRKKAHAKSIVSPREVNSKKSKGTTDHSPSKLGPPDCCRKVTGHVRPVPSFLDSTKLRRDSARAACSDAPSSSAATLFRQRCRNKQDARFEKYTVGTVAQEVEKAVRGRAADPRQHRRRG